MLRHGAQGVWTRMARVVQANLQEHLGPDPLYPDLDEAHEFREHGGMGAEVPGDQVDLVDLEFRDVEQQGDVLMGWQPFRNAVVGRWWVLDTMRTSSLYMGLRMRCLPSRGMMLPAPARADFG